jgi:hypothetical protein
MPVLLSAFAISTRACFSLLNAFEAEDASFASFSTTDAPFTASAAAPREAFTDSLMQVTSESDEGYVTLKDGQFSNGTIEFDIKPVTGEMPRLRFRQGPDGTAERLAPDGRLDLANSGFDVALRKGRNEVVVATDANTPDMRVRYGWEMKMKLDRAEGLSFE